MTQILLCYYWDHLSVLAQTFWCILHIYGCTQHLDPFHYLLGYYILNDTVGEWFAVLKCYFLISFYCFICCDICTCPSNCYSSLEKYVLVIIVTETWFLHRDLQLDLTIFVSYSTCIIHFNPFYHLTFDVWLLVSPSKFMIFCYSIFTLYIDNCNNRS